jgi:hypothetical protein
MIRPASLPFAIVLVLLTAACVEKPPTADDEIGDDTSGDDNEAAPILACLSDSDCSTPTHPLCDAGECVACIADTDCPDPSLPLCTNNTCVAPCTIDAQEPNDSYLAATAVDDTQLFAGSLCPGDEDWFTFMIPDTTYVGISAQYDGRHGDLDFELRDSGSGPGSLAQLANGIAFGYYTAEGIHALVSIPGTYKVRVYLDSGDGGVAYEIRFNLLPHE